VKPKVGIIACSGEKIAGGTITRAAARLVVEYLRPNNTVILCQPLFMAGGLERHGGQQERDFAKDHPTITIEGCEEECARIAVARYSGTPHATIRIHEILKQYPELHLNSRENVGEDEMKLIEIVAQAIAKKVDEIYGEPEHIKF
jgi:hypothetical protein